MSLQPDRSYLEICSLLSVALACALSAASDRAKSGPGHVIRIMGIEEHRRARRARAGTVRADAVRERSDRAGESRQLRAHEGRDRLRRAARRRSAGARSSRSPVRNSIDNFAYNLEFPDRFVSLLLQGEVVRRGRRDRELPGQHHRGRRGLLRRRRRRSASRRATRTSARRSGVGASARASTSSSRCSGRAAAATPSGKVFDTALSPTHLGAHATAFRSSCSPSTRSARASTPTT